MYLFFAIMMMTTPITVTQIDALIQKVNPTAGPKARQWVSETIVEYAPKAGLTDIEDVKLILAVINTESSFVHKRAAGSSGEWGMMQVIPGDAHIRQAARRYVCHKDEMDKMIQDEQGWFKMCNGNRPNIYTGVNIWPKNLARFIKHSPRAGIAIGIQEMAYWKRMYNAKYKAIFWDNPNAVPVWRRKWHEEVKVGLGDKVWICHYNYGGRIKLSITGYNYPLSIMKHLSAMK